MAARKEWPENCPLSGPRCLSSSVRIVSFRLHSVRFFPESKLNTGQSGPLLADSLFSASSVFTGHTPCPRKLNMSTKSPCFDLDFVTFTWISTCSLEITFISFHNSVSDGWLLYSEFGNISPSRNEPKKAVVHAHHITCLLFSGQLVFAISCPSIFRSSNVMTFLVCFVSVEYISRFCPPLISVARYGESKFTVGSDLRLCMLFRELRYDSTVDAFNFLSCKAHVTYSASLSTDSGQSDLLLHSKVLNEFTAASCFFHVGVA